MRVASVFQFHYLLIPAAFGPCRVAGYFGDLGDGVHKGDVNDPRVSAIEVTPEEIHYWYATSGTVSRTAQVAVSAVTGKAAAPGELRTITKAEVR